MRASVLGKLLFNPFFFFDLTGGVAFGHMQDVINALGAAGQTFTRTRKLPAVCVDLLLAFLRQLSGPVAGRRSLQVDRYDQLSSSRKELVVAPDFMLIRDTVAVLIILALSVKQLSTAGDMATARRYDESYRAGMYAKEKRLLVRADLIITRSRFRSVLDLMMDLRRPVLDIVGRLIF